MAVAASCPDERRIRVFGVVAAAVVVAVLVVETVVVWIEAQLADEVAALAAALVAAYQEVVGLLDCSLPINHRLKSRLMFICPSARCQRNGLNLTAL